MSTVAETLARAQAAHQAGQLHDAEQLYRRVLETDADNVQAHYLLGALCGVLGKSDEAIASLTQAIRLKPDHAQAHGYLGAVLVKQRKFEDAVASFRRALELQPLFAEAHNELGIALSAQGEFDQAIACCRRAVELKPDFAEAHSNLGAFLERQGDIDAAAACYGRAVELKPDFVEAHINRGKTLIQLGQFAEGWSEYEWRWQRLYRPPRSQPAWDGSPARGRTLLIDAEQGLGDTLQFVRYVPLLEGQGAKVIVESQRALMPLLSQSGYHVIPPGGPLPSYDLHAPLMSLPHFFKTTLASVPAQVPYLSAGAALSEHWRHKLKGVRGMKVGIVWQVSPNTAQPWRAIPLAVFERLAKLAGVRLVSLQKGLGCEEIAGIADRFSLLDFGPQLDDASGPFMDTAALMTQLDLVITADTATAHLAGGLGVPVWVALPYLACWRWVRARTDSPWYPTMRLFRQDRPGDWDGVFQRIEKELAALV